MLYRRYNAKIFQILAFDKEKKNQTNANLKIHTGKKKTYKGSNGDKIAHMVIKI